MINAFVNVIKPLLPTFLVRVVEHSSPLSIFVSNKPKNPSEIPEVFTFVLLQYNHAELTIDCIKHILLINKTIPVHIVVVDNGSTDGAAAIIKNFCNSIPSVIVLESKANIGFACGNNIGFRHARSQTKNQMICVMNNDVFISDKCFIDKTLHLYKNHSFSILGPDIIVPGKIKLHQNPFRYHLQSGTDISDFIQKYEEKILCVKNKSQELKVPSPNGRRIKDPYRRTGQIVLHGSALVFSPIFINSFDEAFDCKTFLYGEEDILALRAISENQKIMYAPSLKVFHHTKSSTALNDLERYYLFRYSMSIVSAKRYKEILDKVSIQQ